MAAAQSSLASPIMPTSIKVLVTGFGLFLDMTINPSWEIARKLSASIVGLDGRLIQLIVSNDPMPPAYHDIKDQVAALLETHTADLVVHMGLDVGSGRGIFKVERSAPREGYHEFPDIRRKVFTRIENKTTFAKSPAALSTTLDIDAAAEVWSAGCASITLATQRGSQQNAKKGKKAGDAERACTTQRRRWDLHLWFLLLCSAVPPSDSHGEAARNFLPRSAARDYG